MPESGPPPAIVEGDPRGIVTAVARGIGCAVDAAFAACGARVQTSDIDAAAVGDAVSQIPDLAGATGDAWVGHVEYL
jgi:hypothetical protein